MKQSRPLNDDKPRNQLIASLRRLIATTGLKPGSALPTYDDLGVQFRVSRMTVKRAMDELSACGEVRRLHGKGVFVAKQIPRQAADISRLAVIASSRYNLFRYDFLREIMMGIVLGCEANNLSLSIHSLRDFGVSDHPENIAASADSILLLGNIDEHYIHKVSRLNIPVAVIDHQTREVPVDCLMCDNQGAVRKLVHYLVSLGHRNILFAEQPAGLTVSMQRRHMAVSVNFPERRKAYIEAMEEHGLKAVTRNIKEPEKLIATLRALGKAGTKPTVIVTQGMELAASYCDQLHQAGWRIPEDISVVAAASPKQGAFWHGLPVTTCLMHFEKMGDKAVDQLLHRCSGPRLKAPHLIRIGFDFQRGATSGPPPA